MQAQESARARVREIEAAVNRVQCELEEVEERERNAFALKENSIGELVAAAAVDSLPLWCGTIFVSFGEQE